MPKSSLKATRDDCTRESVAKPHHTGTRHHRPTNQTAALLACSASTPATIGNASAATEVSPSLICRAKRRRARRVGGENRRERRDRVQASHSAVERGGRHRVESGIAPHYSRRTLYRRHQTGSMQSPAVATTASSAETTAQAPSLLIICWSSVGHDSRPSATSGKKLVRL